VILTNFDILTGRVSRGLAMGVVVLALAGCSSFNPFGPPKIQEEVIVPPAALYQSAIKDMDAQRYNTAIASLEKLERQSPTSDYAERAKLMQVYGNASR
jgi:outer membrane protein assembly factor BamD